MHAPFANTSSAAHLLAAKPYSEPNSGIFLAQNSLHLRLKLASLGSSWLGSGRKLPILPLKLLSSWEVWQEIANFTFKNASIFKINHILGFNILRINLGMELANKAPKNKY